MACGTREQGYDIPMPRVVIDIETTGVSFDSLDPQAQEYLLKAARTPEERDLVPEQLSFSPLTGQVVCIGMLNPDTDKGVVYFQKPGDSETTAEGDVTYISDDEAGVLRRFWETLAHYDQLITFNGRSFDGPFLMVRSAVHGIRPSKNLVPYRYGDEHIDLYDRLGFWGAVRRTMSLHMWCQAFDIPSSKANGITGYDVPKLYADGRHLDIARYCFDDIRATAELWRRWDAFINIK
jgi:hypothetical protein